MGSELKRLILIGGVALIGATFFLVLPLMKLKLPERPENIPTTALYAKDSGHWIDCQSVRAPGKYQCTVYSPDGQDKLVQGLYQEAGNSGLRRVAYDGSFIYWKRNLLLTSVYLDCVAGGRPPAVADCRALPR